ncbi:MAG: serine hydrolase domain-containing protein [Actinomycetes bacterium]
MPEVLPSTAARLLARTAAAQRDGRLPSLVAGVVRDGGLVWSAGRGAVDEPHDDVQYRLGSISKTVTAVAVMRLREEGRLRLDDPLEQHVPGTPFGSRTVAQLLAHVAGLRAESPTEWWERTPGVPFDELVQRASPDDVVGDAGRGFHYSNLGYGMLGELVARLRGRPWADVVRDEVLLPLGMTRTTPRPEGRAARGWAVHPWADVVLPEPEHDAAAMAPAGQLWATLADLGRFAAFLLDGTDDVLPAAVIEEMAEPAGVQVTAPAWASYGLGLQVLPHEGGVVIGHGGSMPGFLAGVLVDRTARVGGVALTNATAGLDGMLVVDLLKTLHELEPSPGPVWEPLGDVDPQLLALVGTWYWGPYGYGVRLAADGLLHLAGIGAPGRPSRFRPRGDGTFVGLEGYHAGEVLRVVRDDAGEPVALDLGSFVFSRQPYDPAAPHPGGVDPQGWRPGPLDASGPA